jgi:hypothetical protein
MKTRTFPRDTCQSQPRQVNGKAPLAKPNAGEAQHRIRIWHEGIGQLTNQIKSSSSQGSLSFLSRSETAEFTAVPP